MDNGRLARECAKLDRREERALADDGLASEAAEWPEYQGAFRGDGNGTRIVP
jgi:hypothetical protein